MGRLSKSLHLTRYWDQRPGLDSSELSVEFPLIKNSEIRKIKGL